MTAQTNTSSWATYKRLLGYALPYKAFFILSMIGFAIFAATQAAFAVLMELLLNALDNTPTSNAVVDWFYPDGEVTWRIALPMFAIFIFVIRGIGSFLGSFFIERVSQGLIHDLRVDLFNKITVLKAGVLDAENSGHTVSKITFNTQQVTNAATNAVKVLIREGFTVIGLLGYLVLKNWQLTLVFLVIGPLLALIINAVSKLFRRYSQRIQQSAGDITHVTTESVQGFKVVRAFGGINRERERFRLASNYNAIQNLKLAFSKALSTPIMQVIVAAAIGLILFLVLSPEAVGDQTSGSIMAYVTAVSLLPKPIRQLSEINADLQRGIAAGESIFEVLDDREEDLKTRDEIKRFDGRIDAVDLKFSYKDELALNNVSFSVEPKTTVALVGRSGSGKSTITNLLLRFYESWDGSLTIDGKDVREYPLANLREQIALVNQDIVLFNDTIANNIAYGELESRSREEIIAAAKLANAWDFIQALPKGLDTEIGEAGSRLSGGQRQRLAIARALLKDAPILILDEATSALDNESEKAIQDALKHAMENRTTLIVAHRLSTIIDADLIIVMDDGKIIERGSHQELLDAQGYYYQLYQSNEF